MQVPEPPIAPPATAGEWLQYRTLPGPENRAITGIAKASRELVALVRREGYHVVTNEVTEKAGWGSWRGRFSGTRVSLQCLILQGGWLGRHGESPARTGGMDRGSWPADAGIRRRRLKDTLRRQACPL